MADRAELRKAAAKRQAKRREKMRAQADPEAFAQEQAAKEAEEQAAAAKAEAAAADAKVKAEADAAQLAQYTRDAEMGLSIAIQVASEGIKAAIWDQGAPSLGPGRAGELGRVWAPFLAKYLQDLGVKNPALVSAGLVTLGALGGWASECAAYSSTRKAEAEKRRRQAAATPGVPPEAAPS